MSCANGVCSAAEREIRELESRLQELRRKKGSPTTSSEVGGNVLSALLSSKAAAEVDAAVLHSKLCIFKVRDFGVSKRATYRTMRTTTLQVMVVVDTTGRLRLYSAESGADLLPGGFNLEHSSRVTALGHEGLDTNFPLIVTGAEDGSMHVTRIEMWKRGKLILGLMRPMTNETKAAAEAEADDDRIKAVGSMSNKFFLPLDDGPVATRVQHLPFAHSTVIIVKPKSSTTLREHQIVVGDSHGVLHNLNCSGYARARHVVLADETAATPLSNILNPQNGQLYALASRNEVSLVMVGRGVRKQSAPCRAPGRITGIAFDPISVRFLYVSTSTGAVLKFNTRKRIVSKNSGGAGISGAIIMGGKGSSSREECVLESVLAEASVPESEDKGVVTAGSNALAVSGSALLWLPSSRECAITAFNLSAPASASASSRLGVKSVAPAGDVWSGGGVGVAALFGSLARLGQPPAPSSDAALRGCHFSATAMLGASKAATGQPPPPQPDSLVALTFHTQRSHGARASLVVLHSSIPAAQPVGLGSFAGAWWMDLLKGPALAAVAGLFMLMRFNFRKRGGAFSNKKDRRKDSQVRAMLAAGQGSVRDISKHPSVSADYSSFSSSSSSSSPAPAAAGGDAAPSSSSSSSSSAARRETAPSSLDALYTEARRVNGVPSDE